MPFRLLSEDQRAWCNHTGTSNVRDFRSTVDTVVMNALNASASDFLPDLSDEEQTAVFLKSLACVISDEDRILTLTSQKFGLGRDGLDVSANDVSANSRFSSGGQLRLQPHSGLHTFDLLTFLLVSAATLQHDSVC